MNKCVNLCPQGDIFRDLSELTTSIQGIMDNIFKAFVGHKKSLLGSVQETAGMIDTKIKSTTAAVLSGQGEADCMATLELLKGLERIKYSALKMSDGVAAKIKDQVLFSDKAVAELKDTFAVVSECLEHITDLVVTGNPVLADHLISRGRIYGTILSEYAGEHEDRLIKGICLPKSSIIYLTMLDALKDILFNVKIIGEAFKK